MTSSRHALRRFALGLLSTLAVGLAPAAADAPPALIPVPAKLAARSGHFTIGPRTRVSLEGSSADRVRPVATTLAESLRKATGQPLPIVEGGARRDKDAIRLTLDDTVPHPEGYRLRVEPSGIEIAARTPAGLFYGAQTLRQLVLDAPSGGSAPSAARIGAMDVEDAPRFAYRGMHLDVSRHFFPVEFVKAYIDRLAAYKMNVFHWHLTDDQGWRIQIRKYPRLTEVGGWRRWMPGDGPAPAPDALYGGFYTQEQIRDVVRYAEERFVTVVPEIEMPGHSLAVLAAYPELACTPGPFEVTTKWGIFEDILCPSDRTFAFLEDVLTEVVDLFPGPYVHVGGDEVPKKRWKESEVAQALRAREGLKDEEALQSYFTARIARFLAAKGRRILGWDEILEGGAPPGVVVMSWRGVEPGALAARQGRDVIMAAQPFTYFDSPEEEAMEGDPPAHGGHLPLEKVYGFDPVPAALGASEAARILGGQGQLWTEWVETAQKAEQRVLPRMIALAEALWSPREAKSWDGFARRLPPHLARLDRASVTYSRDFFRVKHDHRIDERGRYFVSLRSQTGDRIFFTLDGSVPGPASTPYRGPIRVEGRSFVRAVAVRDGRPLAPPASVGYHVSLATGRPVRYELPFSEKYPSDREHALTSGVRRSRSYGAGWQGFDGTDFDAVVDLGEPRTIRRLGMGFLRDIQAWIMLPRQVEFLVGSDGQEFRSVAVLPVQEDDRDPLPLVKNVEAEIAPITARYVRFRATNYGPLPPWHSASGNRPWLFVDQVFVE